MTGASAGKTIGWGVLGPGAIAALFAQDLEGAPGARLAAVGSRSADKARAFAERFQAERSYGSYEELAGDPAVDVVYVATPHPFHKEHTLLCLEHGKAVLCEKPMAVNEQEAREMAACARDKDLFLMEAMWTRFLPVMKDVRDWLRDGRIGDIRLLTASFGFRAGWEPEQRCLDPRLAGGALLDVGVYVAALASMVFGGPPSSIKAAAHLGETGVDEQAAMILGYEKGALALLSCAVRTQTCQEARIYGTEGLIHIPEFWGAASATLEVPGKEPLRSAGDSGYQYEALEVMSCLRAGKKESPLMPLDESLAIMRTLDEARDCIGLAYPMEG